MASPRKADLIQALDDLQRQEAFVNALDPFAREKFFKALGGLSLHGDRARALLETGDANNWGDGVDRRRAAAVSAALEEQARIEACIAGMKAGKAATEASA